MASDQNNVSLELLRRQLQQAKTPSALKGGGGDGTFDGMEVRVTRLEKQFDKIDGKLDTLVRDVAEMKGRVNAMPTTWQMVGFVVALTVGIFGFVKLALHV